MQCPSCGDTLEVDDRFAYLVVCASCDSSVVLDGRALRLAGKMATLTPPGGQLYLGATGELGGRPFRIIGRVRYGYAAGLWEEWFLDLGEGKTAWISEDEDEMVLESFVPLEEAGFTHDSLDPGDRIQLGGTAFSVTEKDVATCEGGAGQLPFMVVPGEKVPFFDLTGDEKVGTVEFDSDGIRLFLGKVIPASGLTLDHTREEAGVGSDWSAERIGQGQDRDRVVAGSTGVVSIKCTSCGAPQEAPAEGAITHECSYCSATIDLQARQVDCPGCEAVIPVRARDIAVCVVCPGCKGQLDISRDVPNLIASLAKKTRPSVPLKLGKKGKLRDVEYEVVGHLRMVERDAWGSYITDEFFLRPEFGEPRWLVLENGHWSLGKEAKGLPQGLSNPRHAYQKQTFSFGETEYTVFEVGASPQEVQYVEGELPWVARIGDKVRYLDAIAPPKMISAEWTEKELEWFEAEHLDVQEVAEAFKLINMPAPEGVGPCQPFLQSRFLSELPMLLGFFCILMVFQLVGACSSGTPIFTTRVASSAINGAEFITPEFAVTGPTVLQVSAASSVDNAWIYAQMALIDKDDRALVECDAEMTYYHGYEGGESWSEGSGSDYAVFVVPETGQYRLLVNGQGGSGNSGTLMPSRDISITVYQDIQLSRYWIILLILCGPLTLWLGTTRARFEGRRWAPVTDDDDD